MHACMHYMHYMHASMHASITYMTCIHTYIQCICKIINSSHCIALLTLHRISKAWHALESRGAPRQALASLGKPGQALASLGELWQAYACPSWLWRASAGLEQPSLALAGLNVNQTNPKKLQRPTNQTSIAS